MDILKELKNMTYKINTLRPYYDDKNKKYIFCFSKDHPMATELINSSSVYLNVTAKVVEPNYIPDKKNIYVFQEP